MKKEKEIFEQQKHPEIVESINGNRVKRSLSTIANEMLDDTNENDDNEDDEFSHDGYSHSIASMQSLPPTPEPRNVTPTQQQLTRPSSKTSTVSMSSTSSPPPERKATSYINVSIPHSVAHAHILSREISSTIFFFKSINFSPSHRIQRHQLVNSSHVWSIQA